MGHVRTQLMVEYGEPAPFFNSLLALIRHYETYATFSGDINCLGLPDIFPWRVAEKDYTLHAIINRKTLATGDTTTDFSE